MGSLAGARTTVADERGGAGYFSAASQAGVRTFAGYLSVLAFAIGDFAPCRVPRDVV
jgi:hypothetical protein